MTQKNILKKTIIVYLSVAIFCLIFNYAYSYFGHGVVSDSMRLAWLYPLILGSGVYYLLYRLAKYERVSYNLYNAGVATLTTGAIYQGVIDVAGADTSYSKYYFIIGLCLIAAAIGFATWRKTNNKL